MPSPLPTRDDLMRRVATRHIATLCERADYSAYLVKSFEDVMAEVIRADKVLAAAFFTEPIRVVDQLWKRFFDV